MALRPIAENALVHPKEKYQREKKGVWESTESEVRKKGQKIFVSTASQAGNRGDS